ncbi:hypothetical protein VM1G_11011 [Cytospora mali]|uniref:NTF2-like domain-containing protein n=1 Tax=Cytospora mali TaxID=578113 RepID=A0A194VJS9_CYTMA|nr:hypothetical protein VM1G_11011 [Valsa mali]
MRFSIILVFISTTLGAVPKSRRGFPSSNLTSCFRALPENPKTVGALVHNYAQVIGNYSDALASSYLANGFTDVSSSINALAGLPLENATFTSKQSFMDSQETQPKIPLVVTGTYAVTNDTVVIRYTQTFGTAALPVAGISILKFVCEGGHWKLKTIWTEFNSLVYFEDIGGSCSVAS